MKTGLIVKQELLILWRDPLPQIFSILFPIVFIYFMAPVYGAEKSLAGLMQAVPGFTLMFAFFLVGQVGYAFYRELEWCTWSRLLLSQASLAQVAVGKGVVAFLQFMAQLVVVLVSSSWLFGLTATPVGWLQLIMVSAGFAVCLVAMGLLLTAWSSSFAQLTAATNLLAPVLAALGGALIPIHLLPRWAGMVSGISPAYWAMTGMGEALRGGNWGVIVTSLAVLFVFSLIFASCGLPLLRHRIHKEA